MSTTYLAGITSVYMTRMARDSEKASVVVTAGSSGMTTVAVTAGSDKSPEKVSVNMTGLAETVTEGMT